MTHPNFIRYIFRILGASGILLSGSLCGLGLTAQSAQANSDFSNQSIYFDRDTVVEFEFIQSHGAYQSVFGMINQTTGEETIIFQETQPYDGYGVLRQTSSNPSENDTGSNIDFVGTFGETVVAGRDLSVVRTSGKPDGQVVEVPFRANHRYTFFLKTFRDDGSLKTQSLSTEAFLSLDGSLNGGTRSRDSFGRPITGTSLAWEDGGTISNDEDHDDFVVEAGGFAFDPCPDVN